MMIMAEQEELNHLFSDSLTDEDLLRAVERIESDQMSTDQTVQRSDINDATVGSASNLGVPSGSHTQNGKFIIISFEYTENPICHQHISLKHPLRLIVDFVVISSFVCNIRIFSALLCCYTLTLYNRSYIYFATPTKRNLPLVSILS